MRRSSFFSLALGVATAGLAFWGGLAGSAAQTPEPSPAEASPQPTVTLSIPLLNPQAIPAVVASPAVPGAPPAKVVMPTFTVGGPDNAVVVVHADLPFLRHLLLQTTDLQQASLPFHAAPAATAGIKIAAYRMLRDAGDGLPQAGTDYDPQPVGEWTSDGKGGLAASDTAPAALAQLLQKWLSGDAEDHGMLLAAAPGSAPISLSADRGADGLPLSLTFVHYPPAQIFDYPLKPTPGVYAHIRDGKLYYGDQRLRLWGATRHDSPNLAIPARLRMIGFNALRVWSHASFWNDAAMKTGQPVGSKPGDGSLIDQYDRFYAELKKQGIFVWVNGLGDHLPTTDNLKALLQDDSFIAGGDDWPQWKDAVHALSAKPKYKRPGMMFLPLLYFDERTQKVFKANASAFLNHVNPYTGKRYAEDEAAAVWQVQNENGFAMKVLQGELDDWPPYFREELRTRWMAWLKARYHDDAGLKQAWSTLGADESLDHGVVHLGPTLHERDHFPKARGDDYVHFIIDLVVTFNHDIHEFCRAQAPEGVGVNVAPFVFDSQYLPSVPWLASQALSGDTVSVSNYQFALTSSLTAPPGFYTFDNHTVQNHAMLIYETNSGNTNPYRAEYPLRIAALASRQDWDAVFFHYFHAPNERTDEETPPESYLAGKMEYISRADYFSGTHYALDPAMDAAIAIAGRIFLGYAVPPAKTPAICRLADDAVYSYDYFNGVNLQADTFARGSRIAFTGEPTGGMQIDHPPLDPQPDPVTYDPAQGRLIIDAPLAKAYVGRTGGTYQFGDGIEVGHFNRPFVSFAMVSADGKPLVGPDAAQRIYLAAVDNAGNTGFDMDMSIARAGGGFVPPTSQPAAIRSYGRAPVIADAVAYDLWFPTTLTSLFQGYDFALRKAEERSGTDGNQFQQEGRQYLFMGVLSISARGAAADVPKSEAMPAAPTEAASGSAPASPSAALAEVWNPLPGIKWSDDYAAAHQELRDGAIVRSSIGSPEQPATPNSPILLYDAQPIFNAPANIEIDFQNGGMSQIVATFSQPPSITEAVAAYEKQFGPAVQKTLTTNAFETSTIHWVVPQKGADLDIVLTESQGSMSIAYSPHPK